MAFPLAQFIILEFTEKIPAKEMFAKMDKFMVNKTTSSKALAAARK
jgi:hypothetical protein